MMTITAVSIGAHLLTLLIATLSLVIAFESPIISRRSLKTSIPQTTHLFTLPTESNNDNDTPPTMEDNTAAEEDKSWANTAYSGLSNVWGYSRSVVNDRQRRRYERRRIRHRLKLEGKIQGRSPNWAEKLAATAKAPIASSTSQDITAADAFMGNVNKDPRSSSSTCVSWVDLLSRNSDCDTANLGSISEKTTAPTASTTTLFDDEEMNEDGYWGSK